MTAVFLSTIMIGTTWTVGPQLQFNFGGQDWLPVGVQTIFDPETLLAASNAGVKDFNIEVGLTEDWAKISAGMGSKNFLLTVTTAMKPTSGFTAQPQYYRLNDIRKSTQVTAPLSSASSALVVVALKRDGALISSKVWPVENGVLRADLKAADDADQVVLVYPIGESLEMEDLWEGLDERRDKVLKQIRAMGKSPGLRGIINPLGSAPWLASNDNGFVPSSLLFRKEFADYLETKYATLEGVMRAWGMRATLAESFFDMTRFAPLWNAGRGIPYMFDSQTREVVLADSKKSAYWRDLATVVSETRSRRIHRLLRGVRAAAQVPVMQEWSGWSWFFENPNSELSGLAVRLKDLGPSSALRSIGGAMSSNLRSNNPGPVFAIDVAGNTESLTNEVLADLTQLGVRGVFFRASQQLNFKTVAALSLPAPQSRPSGLFFPVNATNPARAQVLSGGLLFLPSPSAGNRLDLGRNLNGYEIMEGNSPAYVIWANQPGAYNLRIPNPVGVTFKSYGGIVSTPVVTKTGVSVELGATPVLIRGTATPPVNESELLSIDREVRQMLAYAISRRLDVVTENFKYRNFAEILKTNPASAYRIAKEVHRMLIGQVTGLTWAEFETTNDNSFSEVQTDAGCSGGQSLCVRTPLGALTGIVHATLRLTQKTAQNQELWLAARIPSPTDRENLRVKVGGQLYPLPAQGIETYGSGYAWYRLGMVRLPSVKSELRVELVGSAATDVGLDCIVLSPQSFTPNAVFLPPMLIPEPPIDPKAPKKPGR